MARIMGNLYGEFLRFVDDFANCTSTTAERVDVKPTSVSEKPDYEYPSDNYLDGALNNTATKKLLKSIASKYYGQQLKEIIDSGGKLSAESFPRLWGNFERCCKTLGISEYPDTYITSKLTGINGLSVELDDNKLMLLSFQTAVLLNDAEQRFLIGHELGHIQQGHLIAHTIQGLLSDLNKSNEILASFVNDFLEVPLNRWYRESEFTADRAGYLCCQDIDSIAALMKKLDDGRPVSAFDRFKELSEAYPNISVRLDEIRNFSKSEQRRSLLLN